MKTFIQLLITGLFVQAVFAQPNTWIQKADFAGGGREYMARFTVGSKAYVGCGNDGINQLKDFWEYDPATDIWTKKADFPGAARSGAVGFSIGDKGYIGSGGGTYYGPYYTDFWEYDPATDVWTKKADFPGAARWMATAFSIGNKGYFGAGANTSGGDILYSDFWEFDPAANNWTRKADFGGGIRSNPGGFSIGNKGYIGCGFNWSGGWQKDFWEYDPATDIWTRKADFGGYAREYINQVGFSIGNKGYLGTGYAGAVFNDFWEYDQATNKWTKKANVGGVERVRAIGFAIGDKGYIGMGSTGSAALKDFWEYTPGIAADCLPPSGLKVTGITKTSALLRWKLPEGCVAAFKIRYRAQGSKEELKRLVKGTDSSVRLYNLPPNTTYEWAIFSVCKEDNKSVWVKGPDFTTAASFAAVSANASSSSMNVAVKTGLQITPNPNKGNFTIQLQLPATAASTTILLYNDFGQLVWQQNLGNISGTVQRTIALENNPGAGLYTVTIQRSDVILNQKMLISK